MNEDRSLDPNLDLELKNVHLILKNIRQGMVLVDSLGIIDGTVSQWMQDVFPSIPTEGSFSIVDVLKQHSQITSEQLNGLTSALLSIVEQDSMTFDLNQHTLPKEVGINLSDNRRILIDFEWIPIVDVRDQIKSLLLVMRDGTDIKSMREISARNALEIAVLNEIMVAEATRVDQFLKSATNYVNRMRERIATGRDNLGADDLNYIRRLIHTIKGNARSAKLLKMATLAHEVEEVLYRDSSIPSIVIGIDRIRAGIDLYIDWQGRIIQRAVDAVTEAVEIPKTLGHLFGQVVNDHADLAKEYGIKSLIAKTPNYSNVQLAPHVWSGLRDALTHLVRNSIDHGLKGFIENAELFLDAKMLEHSMVLHYEDFGRGLDLKKLLAAAAKSGINPTTSLPIDLARLVFNEGISTADSISQISGRGSGMGAARDLIQSFGGSADIKLKEELSSGRWSFKLVINLPI